MIRAAILRLLADVGYGALTMDAVASEAGVGKATIYRRWPNKEALLIDAVAAMKGPVPEPAGESVRDDLVMLVRSNRTGRPVRADSYAPTMTLIDCRFSASPTRTSASPCSAARKFSYCNRCASDSCPGSRPAVAESRRIQTLRGIACLRLVAFHVIGHYST